MKLLALSVAGALTFGAMATAVHAEPSWSDKDRRELYRVQRQDRFVDPYRFGNRGYYVAPREEYYGFYDRPYDDRYDYGYYRYGPRYYRR